MKLWVYIFHERERKMRQTINNCMYMYKKIWGICKLRIILIFCLAIADAINIFLTTFFFKFVIDTIIYNRPFWHIIMWVAIRLGYLLLYQCMINVLHTVIFPKQENAIKEGILLELYEKIPQIDIENYDDPDIYDKITRAINEAENRAMWMLGTLRGLLSSTIQMIVLLISLAILNPISIIIAILGAIVTLVANVVNSKKVYEYEMDKTYINRKFEYIKRIFYLPQYKVDTHITCLENELTKRLHNNFENLDNVISKHSKVIAIIAISGSWIFNFLNIGISSIYVSYKIYEGVMTVGDFSSTITAITNLSNNFLQYSNIIPEFRQHALFIGNYIDVLNIETNIYKKEKNSELKEEIKQIRLNNLYFKYKNSDTVLRNINLQIMRGQKIAIVGENGAGKSTLLNITMGLYRQSEGEICVNDKSYDFIDIKKFYNKIAVVSQSPQIYAFSVRDNVCMSDFKGIKDDLRLEQAIIKSGLGYKIDKLTNGYDTMLTTEFEKEGVNLSGGEAQKLAIARALYQEAELLIMDEPSSALDPKSEKELYEVIDEISSDKTVIIVSHKMSCVKNMDIIYYMENGEIVESGTHYELMETNGRYANAFKLQADRYGY